MLAGVDEETFRDLSNELSTVPGLYAEVCGCHRRARHDQSEPQKPPLRPIKRREAQGGRVGVNQQLTLRKPPRPSTELVASRFTELVLRTTAQAAAKNRSR